MARFKDNKIYLFIILLCLLGIVYRTYKSEGFRNEMGNVAILFAGRISSYEHVYKKLEDIKVQYNPVVFCSINEATPTSYTNNFCDMFGIKPTQRNIEQTVLPKWVNDFVIDNYITGLTALNTYSMFYHENKAFNLLERYQVDNNIRFDIVLYYRADLDSTDTLTLNIPADNTIYLSDERHYFGVNDRMAYGNYISMKKYCSLVEKLNKILIKENVIFNSDLYTNFLNPEMILSYHLNNENLHINKINYNTDLYKFRNDKCKKFNECNS
jgi:hypothetical protein